MARPPWSTRTTSVGEAYRRSAVAKTSEGNRAGTAICWSAAIALWSSCSCKAGRCAANRRWRMPQLTPKISATISTATPARAAAARPAFVGRDSAVYKGGDA